MKARLAIGGIVTPEDLEQQGVEKWKLEERLEMVHPLKMSQDSQPLPPLAPDSAIGFSTAAQKCNSPGYSPVHRNHCPSASASDRNSTASPPQAVPWTSWPSNEWHLVQVPSWTAMQY